MKACFLLPSCRPDLLRALINSWDARPWADDYKCIIALNAFSPEDEAEARQRLGRRLLAMTTGPRHPPFMTRQNLLRLPEAERVKKFIFLDDDMEFLPETRFDVPLDMVETPGVGIVSCNWIRTESPALRARARFEEKHIKQATVNMSGGMVMSREVANCTRDAEPKPYTFCDIQHSLLAYLAGYQNYRYLGSLLVHRIGEANGLMVTYKLQDFTPPDPRWITVRQRKDPNNPVASGLMMPIPSDLTSEAHAEHRRQRAAKGWS